MKAQCKQDYKHKKEINTVPTSKWKSSNYIRHYIFEAFSIERNSLYIMVMYKKTYTLRGSKNYCGLGSCIR
jgi:hypothetical protein